jgi:transcriptional regulator with XRE-family HTH domain
MKNKLYGYIAEKIKELRETYGGKGVSQEFVSQKLGVTPNTVSRWETGTYKPKVADLQKLADLFSVPISVFFPTPKEENVKPELSALLSASKDLHPDDLKDLTMFAEFRKARRYLEKAKKVNKKL